MGGWVGRTSISGSRAEMTVGIYGTGRWLFTALLLPLLLLLLFAVDLLSARLYTHALTRAHTHTHRG